MNRSALSAAVIACSFPNISQVVQAQATRPREFEVATVKPAPPQEAGRTSTRMSVYNADDGRNGRLSYTNISVKEVLGQAYKVQLNQIAGGPAWLGSERFDIQAVIPAGAARDEVMPMLQALLADRFQLKLHRESKTLTTYALTVGKGGSKLKPVETGNDLSINSNRTRWHLSAKTAMARFAEMLSNQLESPVVDETGLSGTYELTLEWAVDTVAQPGDDAAAGPSLFTAIQEQLGLKLEARKGPVEVLVVDRAERPSAN